VLRAFGEEVTILLDGEGTGGKLTMWTEITPPGGGPPPHHHVNEDEAFHVLEGRVAFLSDGEWHEVSPGGATYMLAASFTRSVERSETSLAIPLGNPLPEQSEILRFAQNDTYKRQLQQFRFEIDLRPGESDRNRASLFC